MHQKKYQEAMDEAMASFESAEYPDKDAGANWYRFNRDRTGDIKFHSSM